MNISYCWKSDFSSLTCYSSKLSYTNESMGSRTFNYLSHSLHVFKVALYMQ